MKYKYIINPVDLAKKIMTAYLEEGMIVCDSTVGNGHDTLFLAKKVGQKGRVYGFDIQEEALKATQLKLEEEKLLDRVSLFLEGHENIDLKIEENLDLVIFNLGYLPKGNKSLITRGETSVTAIGKSLKLLKNNGLLLVTCYTGHDGGLEEKNQVEDFLSGLNQKEYNVLEFNFKNQKHCPPILYGVEKK